MLHPPPADWLVNSYIYVYIYIHTHTHASTHTHTHTHIYIYTHLSINLSLHISMYMYIYLCSSEWFQGCLSWGRRECRLSFIFPLYFVYIQVLNNQKKYIIKFTCLLYFRRYSISFLLLFFAFNFLVMSCVLPHKLPQFDVKLAINNFFSKFISDFRRILKQIVEMFFPLLKFSFVAGSF